MDTQRARPPDTRTPERAVITRLLPPYSPLALASTHIHNCADNAGPVPTTTTTTPPSLSLSLSQSRANIPAPHAPLSFQSTTVTTAGSMRTPTRLPLSHSLSLPCACRQCVYVHALPVARPPPLVLAACCPRLVPGHPFFINLN